MHDFDSPPQRLHVGEVRRAFGVACAEPSAPSRQLYRETAARLGEHLDPIRIDPKIVLDLGSGLGEWSFLLDKMYPNSELYLTDFVIERLKPLQKRPRHGRRWFGSRSFRSAVMDGAKLAVRDATADLVTSNLVFHWVDDQPAFVRACSRALRPGGLLMISTLGAATLSELRESWAAHDPNYVHVHPFADMHDIGDQLIRAGFTDVVMDSERVDLTYASPEALLHELRALEGGNLSTARAPGLTTPRRLNQVCETYLALSAANHVPPAPSHADQGRIHATVELVFAHAWAAETATRRKTPRADTVDVPLPVLPRK